MSTRLVPRKRLKAAHRLSRLEGSTLSLKAFAKEAAEARGLYHSQAAMRWLENKRIKVQS